MERIKIGGTEQDLSNIDGNWVHQHLMGLRRDGRPDCVVLTINRDDINICLRTPGCASAAVGGRQPNERERRIFELWTGFRLNETDFDAKDLCKFLESVRRYL